MSGERRSSDIPWNDGGSLVQAGNCEAIADGVKDGRRMAGQDWGTETRLEALEDGR